MDTDDLINNDVDVHRGVRVQINPHIFIDFSDSQMSRAAWSPSRNRLCIYGFPGCKSFSNLKRGVISQSKAFVPCHTDFPELIARHDSSQRNTSTSRTSSNDVPLADTYRMLPCQ